MKIVRFVFFYLFLLVSCTSDKTSYNTEPKLLKEKYLIITADDFGAANNINEGIKIAADKQTITCISVLTNFIESIPELKSIAQKHPEIGIGVHLNITTGKPVLNALLVPSLVNKAGNFYSLEQLLVKPDQVSIDELRLELKAQIMVLIENDFKIDHLSDQNGILSFYGPFNEVMIGLADEFHLPVRSPAIAGKKYPDIFHNSEMLKSARKIGMQLAVKHPIELSELVRYTREKEIDSRIKRLDQQCVLHPDLLIECFWGDPTPANLKYILEHLPYGSSELILHLGNNSRQQYYPVGLDLDYFLNREQELKTITQSNICELCNQLNIKRITFSDLP